MTQYLPTQNYLIITPEKIAAISKGGLHIPEQARNNSVEGVVTHIGPAVCDVQVGDKVVFTEHSEYKIRDEGIDLIVVAESNVILRKPKVATVQTKASRSTRPFSEPNLTSEELTGKNFR